VRYRLPVGCRSGLDLALCALRADPARSLVRAGLRLI